MIEITKNITIKHDGKQYTNNIQTRKILVDDEIYTNYCIIGITEEQAIIHTGNKGNHTNNRKRSKQKRKEN